MRVLRGKKEYKYDYTNIKVYRKTKTRLIKFWQRGETFDAFLNRICDILETLQEKEVKE